MARKALYKNRARPEGPTLEELAELEENKYWSERTCAEHDKLPAQVRALVNEHGGAVTYAYTKMGMRDPDKLKKFAHDIFEHEVRMSFRSHKSGKQNTNKEQS